MTPELADLPPALQPFFLPTERGEILVTTWLPAGGPPRSWLLVAPPFAEELNKSRRMLAMLGRRAAANGWGVLLPDLAGTGDSWGDFRDARYECWMADLLDAARWAGEQGGSVTAVAGLRFGGLLAAELANRLTTINHLLLWQPARSGADVVTPFLRLRTASALTGGGVAGDTLDGLRSRLKGGEALEIAGYELTPELYAAINGVELAGLLPARKITIDWFYRGYQPGLPVPEPIVRAAAALSASGAVVQTHAVPGDPFWATSEIAVCEELVALTVARLGS